MTNGGAMANHLTEAEQELDRHHDVVMDEVTLPGVVSEAGTHDSNMSRVMEGMDDAMADMMSHCSGAGMGEVHEMMTNMQSEMHAHTGALENAADLGSAQTLCASHVADIREMLSTMHGALGRTGCRMMSW
jgi:hypothetical protein